MIAIAVGLYVVAAVVAFVNGNAMWIAMPLIPVHWAIERIRRPPSYRMRMALHRLSSDFTRRSPAIIETRVEPWTDDPLRVSLVCATDAERPALAAQLSDLQLRIASAAIDMGVSPELSSRVEVRAISRQEIDREGGWWGFDHNVSWPRANVR